MAVRLSEQRVEAFKTILARSKAATAYYPALFAAALAVTPLTKRYPSLVLGIGTWIGLAAIAHGLGILRGNRSWFSVGRIGLAGGLGALGLLSVAGFELSWTTFFVLLVALSVAALEVPILAPRLSLSVTVISLIIGPSLISTYVAISGVKGRALALFFTVFFVALVNQARVQRNQFVATLKALASLRKVADVVPGEST